MFRPSLRQVRPFIRTAPTLSSISVTAAGRRMLATGASKSASRGTWKGSVMRWGLAGAAVYIYNTSPIFQDAAMPQTIPSPPQFLENDSVTIDTVIAARREQIKEEQAAKAAAKAKAAAEAKEKAKADVNVEADANVETAKTAVQSAGDDSSATADIASQPGPGSPAALEAEAGQQGAFNPETGEINWDCPCLGGMADGPCGEEFKAAFSCFVFSQEEPKGMDCIDKFQGMQTCFRAHPDVYGAELDDDEPPAESGDGPTSEGGATPAPIPDAAEETNGEAKAEAKGEAKVESTSEPKPESKAQAA
ncbi:Mitochondrial intermembrane space import and assembly protein 40 [Ceratocystis fimbriata CBS 114723]|uniref:Mitochondrial intermembrane space import and assembly protein 40 n=1 Tax=Ceratocystis fimbriata CBS 114723 TaxID=1035309 RepID=A0A2C5XL09_9PEZI|nr:Mitochondrial intermembrane space import and assembly protein 40 [Ceratocystis fimbriata CBS 114723]